MIAAAPPPVVNRIAGRAAPAPRPVPATPQGKQDAWAEAVFAAALFYQAQLAHPDPAVAERAARAIFDLEKTRLRHGRDLAGAEGEKPRPEAAAPPPRTTREDVRRLTKVVEVAMQHGDLVDDADDWVGEGVRRKPARGQGVVSTPGTAGVPPAHVGAAGNSLNPQRPVRAGRPRSQGEGGPPVATPAGNILLRPGTHSRE